MKIAYFGSPFISALLFESLHSMENFEIKLVVTQQDKPAGKQLLMTQTAVKMKAKELKIEVFDKPLNESTEKELILLCNKYQIELCIVFAYGAILSQSLLHGVQYGFWNIHPSLLPKYRGASPLVYPIALGDPITGVSLIQMNEKMDGGDILESIQIPITDKTLRSEIEKNTISLAVNMLNNAITTIQTKNKLTGFPQNENDATFTRRLNKQDGYIPLSLLNKSLNNNAVLQHNEFPKLILEYYRDNHQTISQSHSAGRIVWNMYRALHGWPGIWTIIRTQGGSKRLKITNMNIHQEILEIISVQLEGKKEVSFDIFNRSYNIFNL